MYAIGVSLNICSKLAEPLLLGLANLKKKFQALLLHNIAFIFQREAKLLI